MNCVSTRNLKSLAKTSEENSGKGGKLSKGNMPEE